MVFNFSASAGRVLDGSKEATTRSRKDAPSSPSQSAKAQAEMATVRDQLSRLYLGKSRVAQQFRYGLLVFDAVTIAFIVGTSFMPRTTWLEWLDVFFGLVILTEFCARLFVSSHPARKFAHLATWADMAAMVSFLAPVAGEGLGFLRILRTLRLLHTYQLTAQLRGDSLFFRRNEEVIRAVVNLAAFLFIMTGVVYQTEHWRNPAIANYVDALYFTVTALTTTGFGDITLQGAWGRIISIIIMIFGVTLFLRLLQTLVRPYKVRHTCPACGLQRHEVDAVHCKACGALINIPDEGGF
jgi:voltage-gated potassium channel